MKRIIKPIPAVGIELIPPLGAVVDQHYDYITENDDEDETNAVYICYAVTPDIEPSGFDVVLDKDVKFSKHTFAGWPAPKGDIPVKKAKKTKP